LCPSISRVKSRSNCNSLRLGIRKLVESDSRRTKIFNPEYNKTNHSSNVKFCTFEKKNEKGVTHQNNTIVSIHANQSNWYQINPIRCVFLLLQSLDEDNVEWVWHCLFERSNHSQEVDEYSQWVFRDEKWISVVSSNQIKTNKNSVLVKLYRKETSTIIGKKNKKLGNYVDFVRPWRM
jgi:hypothetical protein